MSAGRTSKFTFTTRVKYVYPHLSAVVNSVCVIEDLSSV